MPRIVRGQLALDTGERLRDLGQKLLSVHEYSGDALEVQLRTIATGIAVQLMHLDTLVRSCRAGKNSYPNFPALRKALGDAGDECYEIQQELVSVGNHLGPTSDFVALGNQLLAFGQRLRLVQFVTPDRATANG